MARIGEQSPLERRQTIQDRVDENRFRRNLFRKGVREARRKGNIGQAIAFMDEADKRGIKAGPGIRSQGLDRDILGKRALRELETDAREADEIEAVTAKYSGGQPTTYPPIGETESTGYPPIGGEPQTMEVDEVVRAGDLVGDRSIRGDRMGRSLEIYPEQYKSALSQTSPAGTDDAANLAAEANKLRAEEDARRKRLNSRSIPRTI